MRTGLAGLPVRRPVATSMLFVAIALLGVIAWQRVPVELIPDVSGSTLSISFIRPGSETEVVERELLVPLERRIAELPDVRETRGELSGSTGTLDVTFEPGADLKVRELDMQRIAAAVAAGQPFGTAIDVTAIDSSAISRFVMIIEVVGGADPDSLRDLVDKRVAPRLESVPGVAAVWVAGGAPREITVRVDPDRAAAAGVPVQAIAGSLARSVRRLEYVGDVRTADSRRTVVVDGRPKGLVSLSRVRVSPGSPVELRHVAEIVAGTGEQEMLYRVDGRPSVALVVFKEETANLMRLGREMRARVETVAQEMAGYAVTLRIDTDGAKELERQLDRLKRLGLGGFLIALVVLLAFLRQPRAVAVVAIAVPASLLGALALLFVAGQSLNLITLFGLAVAVGMLVDNAIVVFEAVQRGLEHGFGADRAAAEGIRRTIRAILAATATNTIVFLPILLLDLDDAAQRALLAILALSIVLPIVSSLLVAVGLVPLLARRLAAPAARARIEDERRWRRLSSGLAPPDRWRALFSGLLAVALRRPGAWLVSIAAALLVTILVGLPVVMPSSVGSEAAEADVVRAEIDLPAGTTLERAASIFDRIEAPVRELEFVDSIVSLVRESGGSLTVRLVDEDERDVRAPAERIRAVLREAAAGLATVADAGAMGGGSDDATLGLLGRGSAEIVVSGPDAGRLRSLASEIKRRLDAMTEVASAELEGRDAQQEVWVVPRRHALESLGLRVEDVLPAISALPREGVVMRTGFTLADGREIPLTVRREGGVTGLDALERLRVATAAGVRPLPSLAEIRRMPAPATIRHRDGRREISVRYRLTPSAPKSGPARQELDRRIRQAIVSAHRPAGYAVEPPDQDRATRWFARVVLPVLLLLYAVLAITFESLLLPLLVLLALPLTLLGTVWALVVAGRPADVMALVGAVALLGLAVNPAILLVDRMQARFRGGWSAGAAALAAVHERVRPVLMTSATTVAGLWPLALDGGRQFEIWPGFATVVMGGLVATTILTLLVIPVGFVIVRRLESLLGRLGPWLVIAWIASTTAVVLPLFASGTVSSLTWRIVTTLLVAAALLALGIAAFGRGERPEPRAEESGPPLLSVRFLHKTYGLPGPIGRALALPAEFARRVVERGGIAYHARRDARNVLPLAVLLAGAVWLALSVRAVFWQIVWAFVAAALAASLLALARRLRGRVDRFGRRLPGGPEGALRTAAPWVALALLGTFRTAMPLAEARDPAIAPWVLALLGGVLLVVQLARRTAVRIADGRLPLDVTGRLHAPRRAWRAVARRVFGLDLAREQVHALIGVEFDASGGMIGVLGPNGAGKTTLLRQLAGILDATRGRITLGGVSLSAIRRRLARWVGYLPQDFGLPQKMSAREYLDYFALLYGLGDPAGRRSRVERLLQEVGLAERADDPIGSYSGGMRQRVAVARTLLRLPPTIIVDEPTVGLDPRERIRFRNLLTRLSRGRTVLFSTHVVEDVAASCQRVLVLARGRVAFDGPPADLARIAEGRVWQLEFEGGAEPALSTAARVVDRIPSADGTTRARILADGRPHARAEPQPPSLEDGYLLLLHRARAEAA